MLSTLTFIHEVIRERELVGGAAEIYTRMFNLAIQPGFAPSAGVRAKMDAILDQIATVSERKARCHAIADILVTKLFPRFIKDQALQPGETREAHCVDWIAKNRDLNPDTDFEDVFAGFLAMFQ